MKILHVTNLGYEHGGVETGLVLLKPIFERMGHTVKIATSNYRSDMPHFSDFEFDALAHQPKVLQILYRLFYPKAYFFLRHVLKEYQPDVVHLHTLSQISPSILFLLKKYPTVVTVHQTEDYTPSILLWSFPADFFTDGSYRKEMLTLKGWMHYVYHRYINGVLYKVGFKNVDLFIAISLYMQSQLKSDGIESVHIPNSTKLFTYSVPNDSHSVLFVGRLERTKGVQDIIQAFPTILARCPDARLVIVGRGEYRAELEKQVSVLELTRCVDFLGYQERERLGDAYKNSSVVVMPSIWPEAFGNVGIEAMSVGRPVIASKVGGTSDWLIDGTTGYFVEPGNPGAIAERVIELFTSPQMLREMSENARTQALNFDIEKQSVRLAEVYAEVIQKHSR